MKLKQTRSLNFLSFLMAFLLCFGLLPTIQVKAASSGAPGTPKLASNKWGGDTGGDFDLTFNMYYGNNGTSYKLYEKLGVKDYKVVSEGTLSDNSPSAQSLTIPIRDRKLAGTYSYYLELTNKFGTSTSNILDLNVGDKDISKSLISGIDDNGSVYQFTIPQGHSEYTIQNFSVKNPKYSVISSNTDSVKATIKNENVLSIDASTAGRSGLKIVEATSGDVRHVGVRVKNSDGTNPGMPKYLSMGSVSQDTDGDLNFWKDSAADLKNKRTDVRYIYINGGPNGGWRSWTMQNGKGDGDRARTFIKESLKLGMIPFFVFYNIPDNDENFKVDIAHIQSKEYMEGYYKDLKYLLDICKEFGDDTVGLIFEPDFLGYMMQQSGKRPSEISATVDAAYSSGILSKDKDPAFENNVKGLVNSINYTVKKYYPQAYYGWQFNIWSFDSTDIPGQGLLHKTELVGQEKGREFIKGVAKATADYYNEAGITNYGASFISIDKYGLDGGFEDGAATNPLKSKWLWNADIWNNYLLYTKTLHETTKLPVVLWQLPVGHLNGSTETSPYTGTSFPTLTNKVNSYEDSAPNYFLGDTFVGGSDARTNYFGANVCNDPKVKVSDGKITWGDHMQEAKDAGIISMLFGAGVNGSTHSTGTPPDDAYWFITKIQKYYQNPLSLDGTNTKPVTPTDPVDPVKPVTPPLAGVLAVDNKDNLGNYTLTVNLPAKHNATGYKLLENNKEIASGSISPTDSKIEKAFNNKSVGTYKYTVELLNSAGTSISNSVESTVKETPIIPQPSSNVDVKFDVTSDWGSGANFTLTLTNNTNKDISLWSLEFTSPVKINSLWNGVLTSSGNNKYRLTPPSWGLTIPKGKSIQFGGSCEGNSKNASLKDVNFTIK